MLRTANTTAPSLHSLQRLAHEDLMQAVELGQAAGRRAQAEAFAAAFGRLRRGAGKLLHRAARPAAVRPVRHRYERYPA